MTQHPEREPVAQSFADHVRDFHDSLPAAEQALLEQVFTLAEQTAGQVDDAEGYLKLDFGSASARITPDLSALLGSKLFAGVEGAKKL